MRYARFRTICTCYGCAVKRAPYGAREGVPAGKEEPRYSICSLQQQISITVFQELNRAIVENSQGQKNHKVVGHVSVQTESVHPSTDGALFTADIQTGTSVRSSSDEFWPASLDTSLP